MKSYSYSMKFSYWVFIWFLFYIFGYIEYNPLFILLLGVSLNIYNMSIMFRESMYKKLIVYLIINLFIKVIPILVILYFNTNYFNIIFDFESFKFLLFLFFIYLIYMKIMNVSIYDVYNAKNSNNTPLANFIYSRV